MGSTKAFKGAKDLKMHYTHAHKDFLSDFEENFDTFFPALTNPTLGLNDIICQRCTDNIKICKGIRGLRLHYSHAHVEFLSDLSQQHRAPSDNVDHANFSFGLDEFAEKLVLYKQTIRVLKRIPRGVRTLAARKLEELINLCAIR